MVLILGAVAFLMPRGWSVLAECQSRSEAILGPLCSSITPIQMGNLNFPNQIKQDSPPPAIDRATNMPSLQHKHILKTDFEDNDTPKKYLEIANHIPTTPQPQFQLLTSHLTSSHISLTPWQAPEY